MELHSAIEPFLIFELCEAHLKSRGGLVPNERAQSEFYGPGNQSREFEAWLHFGVAGLSLMHGVANGSWPEVIQVTWIVWLSPVARPGRNV